MILQINVLQVIGLFRLSNILGRIERLSCIRYVASVLLLASIAFNGHAQDIEYHRLTQQEKADLARYLGWVWADGRPGYDGTGILYKGGNPNYKAVVTRLTKIKISGIQNPFGFPESGNRKLTQVWDYWENSLPGGNPSDPQILRELIKHPNFLAGILEGEGQIFHSDPDRDFYIADQSYAPSHPDKYYDVANFGPERMIQLFSLLQETYGFSNPTISIGNTKYDYNSKRCKAIEKIREKYNSVEKQNKKGNLQPSFTVKIYVNPPDFDEIRGYGFFQKSDGKYRTPAPDRLLRIIKTSEPDLNAEVTGSISFFSEGGTAGVRLRHSSGYYLNSNLNLDLNGGNAALNWNLVDLNNGYYRIVSQDTALQKRWLQAQYNKELRMEGEEKIWHYTQWEKIPVPNSSDRYYLKNRYFGTHLRVGAFDSIVKHGVTGSAAQWTLEATASCAP